MNDFQQTQQQIIDRYNAKKAIFQAMTNGRHISLLDSQEFKVAEMHTTICNIRKDLATSSTWELKDKWIDPYGKKIKEYWLEKREA